MPGEDGISREPSHHPGVLGDPCSRRLAELYGAPCPPDWVNSRRVLLPMGSFVQRGGGVKPSPFPEGEGHGRHRGLGAGAEEPPGARGRGMVRRLSSELERPYSASGLRPEKRAFL
jgi:hypothetical protein